MFSIGRTDLHFYYHRAVYPLGAWTGPVDIGPMGIAGQYPWHLDVIWHGGKFRALLDLGPFYESRPDGYRAGTWDATTTWDRDEPALVNGLPVVGWTEHPRTETELASRAEQNARLDNLAARVARIEAHLWPAPPDDPTVDDWDGFGGIWPNEGLLREDGIIWRNVSGAPLTTPPSGFPGATPSSKHPPAAGVGRRHLRRGTSRPRRQAADGRLTQGQAVALQGHARHARWLGPVRCHPRRVDGHRPRLSRAN